MHGETGRHYTDGLVKATFYPWELVSCAIIELYFMSDNLLVQIVIQFFLCDLMIACAITTLPAIIPKEITLEDSIPWSDDKDPEPLNEIARYDKRIFNFLMDCILFFVLRLTVFNLFPPSEYFSHRGDLLMIWITPVTALLWLLYYPVMEYNTGKTLAKYITQTKVVTDALERVDFYHVFKRNIFRMLPLEWFSFIRRHPIGWHDQFSYTRVVNAPLIPDDVVWESDEA